MKLEPCSENVFRCRESPLVLDPSAIEILVRAAGRTPLRRARVCMHADDQAPIHEMLIVLLKGVYIRPHKHVGKSESFHLLRGSVGVVWFDESGNVTRRERLGDAGGEVPFYYRIDEPLFHSQVVLSDYVVFHECTAGPFRREDTIHAPWSPPEGAPEASAFVQSLSDHFENTPGRP